MFKNFSFSDKKTQEKEKTLFFRKLNSTPESNTAINVKKALWIVKLILYGFSFLMILWSFIQSFAEPYTTSSPEPGQGLEFGFLPGKIPGNDSKYVVSALTINPLNYHAFYMPTLKYGPFLSIFVYPFAYIFLNLIYGLGRVPALETTGLNVIFSIILMLCFMRFLSFFATLRGAYYAEKQHGHKANIDKISRKYSDDDVQTKNKKQAEITAYNHKHNLKPFAQLENFFIITPIFLITYKIVTIMRPIKFTVLFGVWNLAKTPKEMIFSEDFWNQNGWAYLLLCLMIIPVNYVSQKIPMWLTKRRNANAEDPSQTNPYFENTKKIQTALTVMFLLFCFFWQTGLAIYYFFNSLFTIGQSFFIHWLLIRWKNKKNTFEDELKKFGIN